MQNDLIKFTTEWVILIWLIQIIITKKTHKHNVALIMSK